MKAAVICFSQTGNTRKIAERIHDGLLGSADQCDLMKMEAVDGGALTGYDLIGLGCPVFYYNAANARTPARRAASTSNRIPFEYSPPASIACTAPASAPPAPSKRTGVRW